MASALTWKARRPQRAGGAGAPAAPRGPTTSCPSSCSVTLAPCCSSWPEALCLWWWPPSLDPAFARPLSPRLLSSVSRSSSFLARGVLAAARCSASRCRVPSHCRKASAASARSATAQTRAIRATQVPGARVQSSWAEPGPPHMGSLPASLHAERSDAERSDAETRTRMVHLPPNNGAASPAPVGGAPAGPPLATRATACRPHLPFPARTPLQNAP